MRESYCFVAPMGVGFRRIRQGTKCTATRSEEGSGMSERGIESQMYPPNLPTAGQEQMNGDPSPPAIRERERGEALSSSLSLLPSKRPLFARSSSPRTPRPTCFLSRSTVYHTTSASSRTPYAKYFPSKFKILKEFSTRNREQESIEFRNTLSPGALTALHTVALPFSLIPLDFLPTRGSFPRSIPLSVPPFWKRNAIGRAHRPMAGPLADLAHFPHTWLTYVHIPRVSTASKASDATSADATPQSPTAVAPCRCSIH
ncbi:hypothetical protein KM043_010378 [Ampulex compressa]|nr:hypothetical protein KM043_010378 [Ampulex compressa]